MPAITPPRRRLGPVDRSATERMSDDLVSRTRAEERTRVLVVRGDAAPRDEDGALHPFTVAEVERSGGDATWAFLGRRPDGAAVLLAAFDADASEPLPAAGGWGSLRAVSADLDPDDAGLFVTAVALGRWLRDSAHCPFCGTRTVLRSGGWSRRCPHCGREHFPRTDPAVIVAVTHPSDPDRLLLGSNAMWGENRFSCFAGFAEAGESLEDAIVRELHEEAGIVVRAPRYVASQSWPYPRSLMLGFTAEAPADIAAEADGEEIVQVRWFTRAEIVEALAGAGPWQLPGPASIAHRLIREWAEGVRS
jgi:NAD+ diphosphatase